MTTTKDYQYSGSDELSLLVGRLMSQANMMDAFAPSDRANDIRVAAALIIEFQDKMNEAFKLVADAVRMASPRV